jgi:hypothetical protein
MKRFSMKLLFLSVFAASAVSSASAGTITFNLDVEFSGATAPAGMTPWVEATFEDVVGGVRLTIEATNLVGTEFISGFYFNFNPSLNATDYFPTAAGTGTQIDWDSIGARNDFFRADGDGYFDFKVDFPTSGSAAGRFSAGETFVLDLLFAGISVADFDYPSVNGPPGKNGFYAAAHIQGIGPSGNDSGWIGALNGQVPEPSSLLLLVTALGLAPLARRKSIGTLKK